MEDMIGKRIGRLVIVAQCGARSGRFVCKCDCGNTREYYLSQLNEARSCGCLSKELSNGKDGKTRLHKIWSNMKQRCSNPKVRAYKTYGGRGITVCDEWKDSFKNFKEWAYSNGYNDTLTIERIDVNGNYEPSNCKWITLEEQVNNKTNSVWIEVDGIKKTAKQWSRITGIPYNSIISRVNRGVNPRIIVTAKSLKCYTDEEIGIKRKNTAKPIMQFTKDGQFVARFDRVKDAAKTIGCSPSDISENLTGRSATSHGYVWKYAEEGR